MIKNSEQLKKRREFVKDCINNPKQGAKIIKRKIKGLENCRTATDTTLALKDILFLSEATIYNDLYE